MCPAVTWRRNRRNIMRTAHITGIPGRWESQPRPGLLPSIKDRVDKMMAGPEDEADAGTPAAHVP